MTEVNVPTLPEKAYVLLAPDTTDLVAHREGDELYPFLLETRSDAELYAQAAKKVLGFLPQLLFVRVADLTLVRTVRYKPANSGQIDVPLR